MDDRTDAAQEGYQDHSRPDVCDLVARYAPIPRPRVLDLGCASGRLGEALKAGKLATVVHGIERDGHAAEMARQRLDKVWTADLSRFDWDEVDRYDVVVAADVLEHLADPWEALRRLHAVLAPGGRIIASIPNVRYWKVIADLLWRGEFRYADEGVLDRTHLRFFTRRSIVRLFEDTMYRIVHLAPKPIERTGWKRAVMTVAGDLAHVQFHVVARPDDRRVPAGT